MIQIHSNERNVELVARFIESLTKSNYYNCPNCNSTNMDVFTIEPINKPPYDRKECLDCKCHFNKIGKELFLIETLEDRLEKLIN